ncbi:hypothetical protein Q5752_002405 [Cryptotrichosporon argae]
MSTASHGPPETPRSGWTARSGELAAELESELADLDIVETEEAEAVHYCLLAEFDIDAGATLAHQYPFPTGTDEHRLAELMLPDGAHLRPEDWTIFYLGQTPSSAIAPVLEAGAGSASSADITALASRRASMLLPDERPQRGAAGGGLLYVLNCVRMKEDKTVRRGAMVKAMAIATPNPYIGIYKPLLLLALEEYFASPSADVLARLFDSANAISTTGMPGLSRGERILLRQTERKDLFEDRFGVFEPASAARDTFETEPAPAVRPSASRKNSAGSSLADGQAGTPLRDAPGMPDTSGDMRRRGVPRDTHFFETEAKFKKITVPIRIPMTVFDEDVGDYSIIELVQTFSSHTPFPAPFHPYLHTNGAATHPVILILNAIIAHKRVVFLGHGLPAHQVAKMVLAACAMASGCGQVLRGFTESAFPYANLASLDVLEEFSGYVAGVCNPRFEELPTTWDVLCNLETGRVTVSKELKAGPMSNHAARASQSSLGSGSHVGGTSGGSGRGDGAADDVAAPAGKMASAAKADSVDAAFMDEIQGAMAAHLGEAHIRVRFAEYMERFVRLASYQEFIATGTTRIGWPAQAWRDGQLGSGAVFADEQARSREMWANGHRIDAWRRTKSYRLFQKDWARDAPRREIGFDLQHQVSRLRVAKNMPGREADAIFAALAGAVRSYDQVIELLTYLPAHRGGLIPIATGLFHTWPSVRENTIDLLLTIQQYLPGRIALLALNYYYRKTYLELLERRDIRAAGRARAGAGRGYDDSSSQSTPVTIQAGVPGMAG